MTRQHGTMHNRFRVEAAIDGQHSHAVLIPPQQPTRRRSPDLSAYDRLDPPKPRRYGKGRMAEVEGMDRLCAALDRMEAQVNAKLKEAVAKSPAAALRDARMQDASYLEAEVAAEKMTFMGFDVSVSPDVTGFSVGFRWPDGSIRPYAHKRSDTFW